MRFEWRGHLVFVESLNGHNADATAPPGQARRLARKLNGFSHNGSMRTAFLIMVSASLIIHAVLGCCWHDTSPAAGCGSPVLVASGSGCGFDHGGAPSEHHSHQPSKGHSHCHATCIYLPVQKTHVGKVVAHAAFDIVAAAAATGHSQVAAQCSQQESRESARGPPCGCIFSIKSC